MRLIASVLSSLLLAFSLLCRLLSLQPEGDPGYTDVAPGDWYYEIASAARTAGLSSQQIRSIYVDNSIRMQSLSPTAETKTAAVRPRWKSSS